MLHFAAVQTLGGCTGANRCRRAARGARHALAGALAWLALAACGAGAAESGALLTIVEGPATVIDGVRSLRATAGMRLSAATLIDTAAATGLVRVEFADGSTLDLGPDTRAMLQPPGLAGAGPRGPAFYLLQGWAKHSSAAGATSASGQLSPALELMQLSGVAVSRVTQQASQLFVESGKAQLLERSGKGGATLALKAGEFYAREGGEKGRVATRPAPGFLQAVPRSFRDTIAPRAAQFKGKAPEPQVLAMPGYAALEPWLTAEPVIRREFPRRFAAFARVPAFREALSRQMSAHPEWEPVLNPPPALPASTNPARP